MNGKPETYSSSAEALPDATDGTPSDTVPEAPPVVPPVSKVEELSTSIGLLNFRQITPTFTSLTGVTFSAPAAAGGSSPLTEYRNALTALPVSSDPAAITGGKVAAAGKLAAAYCDVLANNRTLLAEKFPGLNLGAVPTDSAAFAKTLIDVFYGAETSLQGDRATDIQSVASTVDALKAFSGVTGPAIFTATCAGILSSAEFLVY